MNSYFLGFHNRLSFDPLLSNFHCQSLAVLAQSDALGLFLYRFMLVLTLAWWRPYHLSSFDLERPYPFLDGRYLPKKFQELSIGLINYHQPYRHASSFLTSLVHKLSKRSPILRFLQNKYT